MRNAVRIYSCYLPAAKNPSAVWLMRTANMMCRRIASVIFVLPQVLEEDTSPIGLRSSSVRKRNGRTNFARSRKKAFIQASSSESIMEIRRKRVRGKRGLRLYLLLK
ncbi:hypothetical protein D3C86_721340 [compost metagenome]